MALPAEFDRFQPPPEVQDLGPPDQMFCNSALMAAIYRYGTRISGLVLLYVGLRLMIGYFREAPVLASAGGCMVAALAALIIRWGWRRSRPWCYLIYPDGMAFTPGQGWEMLGWVDVVEFHSADQGHGPFLLMKDGSQVHLHHAVWFHEELHERIGFCLLQARSQPEEDLETEIMGRSTGRLTVHVLETMALLKDGWHPAENVLRSALEAAPTSGRMRTIRKTTKKKREELPLDTMMIGGLLLIAAGWVYYYLNNLERMGDERWAVWLIALTNKIGGKVLVAGVIALAAMGVMYRALRMEAAEDDSGDKQRRK